VTPSTTSVDVITFEISKRDAKNIMGYVSFPNPSIDTALSVVRIFFSMYGKRRFPFGLDISLILLLIPTAVILFGNVCNAAVGAELHFAGAPEKQLLMAATACEAPNNPITDGFAALERRFQHLVFQTAVSTADARTGDITLSAYFERNPDINMPGNTRPSGGRFGKLVLHLSYKRAQEDLWGELVCHVRAYERKWQSETEDDWRELPIQKPVKN
jgi:hypothetical protein